MAGGGTGNINLVISARANLGAATKQVQAMGRGMAAVQQEVNNIYKKASQTGDNYGHKFRNITEDAAALRNEYRTMMQASGQYMHVQKNLTADTTRFNEALARQKVGFGQVHGQMKMVRAAMREQMALNNMVVSGWSKNASGQISADIFVPKAVEMKRLGMMRAELGYYNQVLKSVSTQTVNWGKNIQWTGRQLTVGFTVPLTIAMGLLSKFGLEADRGLTRVAKVYGDTQGMFQATNDAIKKMAKETAMYIADQYGIAAKETRDVMAELAATGMEGPELQKMTVQVQRASLLGELSSDDSLKLLRIMKEVYGFSSAEIKKQVDYFNAIENSTALTMQDITEGLPRISGIMKATGVSVQEQTELLVAFKSAGIEVAEGANALKSINFKAVAGSPTAKNNFLKITGVEMQSLIDKTDGEFLPMMKEIANVMDGLEQKDKVELVARVFGIHQGSRAITLLDQLSKGSEGMMRATEIGLQSAEQHARAANAEIETIQESAAVRFDRMIQKIRASMESMGQPVLEVLIPIGEKLAELFVWFDGFSDKTKKVAAAIGLTLAAIGPLVMLVGLFGNLIGTFGKFTAGIIGLVAPFKVLDPAVKAAELLQRQFGTATQQSTLHTRAMTGEVEKLAAGMGRLAAATERSYAAQNRPRQMVTPGGKSVPSSAVRGGVDLANPAALAAAKAQTDDLNKSVGRTEQGLKETNKQVTKIGRGLVGATGAMMGLSLITKNETLQNVSMVALGLSMFLPILDKATSGLNGWSNRIISAGGNAATGVQGAFARAATGMQRAFGAFATFMMGPWGVAIAGAILAATWLIKKHNDEVKATQKAYENLADSAEALGSVYDFTPTSIMDRETTSADVKDPNGRLAQDQRLKEMREEQEEYYSSLVKFSERVNKQMDETRSKQEIINEAIAQGRTVLAQTGDPELAKRAAWDVYTIMSGEFMSFSEFKIRVKADDQSVDEIIDTIETATQHGADRLQSKINNIDVGGLFREGASKEDQAAFRAQFKEVMDSIYSIEDAESRLAAFNRAIGPQLDSLSELHAEALSKGWIDADVTAQEFIENLGEYYDRSQNMSKSARDKMGSPYSDYTRDEIMALKEVGLAYDDYDEAKLQTVFTNEDYARSITRTVQAYDAYIDKEKEATLVQELGVAEKENNVREIKRIKGEIDGLRGEAEATHGAVLDAGTKGMEGLKAMADPIGYTMGKAGEAGKKAGQDIADGMEEATEATEELSDAQQRHYDAYRSSMEYAQDELVDQYVEEFENMQEAEREAEDKRAKSLIDGIEASYDNEEKILEADHEGRKEALEERFNAQKKALDAEKERAEKSMEATHKAQSKALENQHEIQKKALDRNKEIAEKALASTQKQQSDALDSRHEAQKKALDAEKERAEKTLKAAQKAETKALEARGKANQELEKRQSEALKERFKMLDEQMGERQEKRREALEKFYDMQVDKIKKQIEAEERLEAQRQKMYERERERLSRMSSLFSSNIDLNMAVNTGDLDQAAKIASDMQNRQSEWATQDVGEISEDASKKRRDGMQKKIDRIEEEKKADLERIKEVEEAEKKALEEQQKREEKALEKKFERIRAELEREKEKLQELHEMQREALNKDFSLRSEHLNKRQSKEKEYLQASHQNTRETLAKNFQAQAENLNKRQTKEKEFLQASHENNKQSLNKDFAMRSENLERRQKREKATLDKTTQAEKEALGVRRNRDVQMQEVRNADNKKALDRRLRDDKKSFDEQADYWRRMVARNEREFISGAKSMNSYFKNNYGVKIRGDDRENWNKIWDNRHAKHKREFNILSRDSAWKTGAANIADRVMRGLTGEKMSAKEIGNFIKKGTLPKHMTVSKTKAVPRHSGGIIGRSSDDKWTGPGYRHSGQEIDVTALKGEGVLNLHAMQQPGVPELMYALNSGQKIDKSKTKRKPHTGDGPGISGGLTQSIAAIYGRYAHVATVAGAEHGVGKAMAKYGVDGGAVGISYDGKQGKLNNDQLSNAGFIISAGRRKGASARDIKIALMTAMQESNLINVNYGDDRHGVRNSDGTLTSSLGLFQQQKWWGSKEERMNPSRSAELFYEALFKVKDRDSMATWQAAQSVQRSAFPRAYAKWESLAAALMEGAGSGGAPRQPTVASAVKIEPGMTWPALWKLVKSVAPETRLTSSYRPGARTRGYGNLSYHGKGQAIDIASPNMMKTYNKLIRLLPWSEAIYTPAGSRQMRHGKFYRERNPITMMDHIDHIHLAYDGKGGKLASDPGGLGGMAGIITDPTKLLADREKELREAIKQLKEAGINFNTGGQVPGKGNTDSVRVNATPGEFIMNKAVTMKNIDLFRAINQGNIDLMPNKASLGHSNVRPKSNIDNLASNRYDVNIEFSGPVSNEIDVEKVVRRTINSIDRNKSQSRRIR